MKNLNLIMANDQDFGNDWGVSLIKEDGTHEFHKNFRPQQFHGCHGICTDFNNNIHLLSEDDGHFRTLQIMTEEEINTLYEWLKDIPNEFTIHTGKRWRMIPHNRNQFRWLREHPKHTVTIQDRKESTPLIGIDLTEDQNVVFDISWLEDFVKVLDIQ